MAGIAGVILAGISAAGGMLAWATTQAMDYGSVKQTVAEQGKMLEKMDKKLDILLTTSRQTSQDSDVGMSVPVATTAKVIK